MKWKLVALVGVAIAAGAGAVALSGSTSSKQVGGQRFEVPKDRLFEDTIPWLPASEADAFTFVLDASSVPDQFPLHLVLVEPAERVCRSNRMSQIVRVACGRERTGLRVVPPFQKAFPHPDYPYGWNYNVVGPPTSSGRTPEQLQVAYCSPISPNPARPKGTAICRTIWGVNGLVLSLGFEEHELNELPLLRERATKMLLSWKAR